MSSGGSSVSIDARRHFLQALQRMLRPIIRLMIRNGVRYDEFVDISRGAYVESAVRDGIGGIAHPTRDQIAWSTGISRQRVDHYIDDDIPRPMPTPTPMRVMAELLHRWHTDPKYLDSYGAPLELEVDSPINDINFRKLVAEVDEDTNPHLILSGLLETKSVTYSDEGRVRALSRFFIWSQGSVTGIEHFGSALARMIETLEHNLNSTNSETKRLERSVFADRGVPIQLLPSFHSFAVERASNFLCDVDDWFAQNDSTGATKSEPIVGVGVYVFFYLEQTADLKALSTLTRPRRGTAASGSET